MSNKFHHSYNDKHCQLETNKMKALLIILIFTYSKLIMAKEENPYCSLHCKVSKAKHTCCPCKKAFDKCTTLYKDRPEVIREIMVKKHNELRNTVALGEEKRGGMGGVTASNMEVINYDIELETIALCHVRRCKFKHDECRDKLKMGNALWVGQNLGWSSKYIKDPAKQDEMNVKLIQIMYDEFDKATADFPNFIDKYGSSQPGTGHLTAIIWGATSQIGCAVSYDAGNNKDWLLTCVYYPGGNINGEKVFKKGPAASECENGQKANSEYKGLCGELLPIPTGPQVLPPGSEGGTSTNSWLYIGIGIVVVVIVIIIVIVVVFREKIAEIIGNFRGE